MLACGICHHEVKREWKCKCRQPIADSRMDSLNPFISKLNGWANFLNFVKTSVHQLEYPTPKEIEVHIPDDFEPDLNLAMKVHILRVLHLHEGNKSATAEALGISVKTVYNKLESWGMLEHTMRLEQ